MIKYHLKRVALEIVNKSTILPDQAADATVSPTDSPEMVTTKHQISLDIQEIKRALSEEAIMASNHVFDEEIDAIWKQIESTYNSGFEEQLRKSKRKALHGVATQVQLLLESRRKRKNQPFNVTRESPEWKKYKLRSP